jgi:hypothetical protein
MQLWLAHITCFAANTWGQLMLRALLHSSMYTVYTAHPSACMRSLLRMTKPHATHQVAHRPGLHTLLHQGALSQDLARR